VAHQVVVGHHFLKTGKLFFLLLPNIPELNTPDE
jgi:hypothetical protein